MSRIPKRDEWLASIERALETGGLTQATPGLEQAALRDHVLATIVDLLDDYDSLRTMDKQKRAFRKHLVAIYLMEATQFWLAKGQRTRGAIAGFAFEPRLIAPVMTSLHEAAAAKVRKDCGWLDDDDLATIRNRLTTSGVGTPNHDADADRTKKRAVWLTNDDDRAGYKLRFRGGLAHRMQALRGEHADIAPYTSPEHESEFRDGYQHFVMDRRGRIYCGYARFSTFSDNFVHSSFVGGDNAMAAGMMKIDSGRIVGINNNSGHYRPEGRHMALVLQRLRLYGVDLSRVTVGRINVNNSRVERVFRADEVLSWNGWPE